MITSLGLETDAFALEPCDDAVDHQIAIAGRIEPVGAILLKVFAQCLCGGLDQARFQRVVFEEVNLDGSGARRNSVSGAPICNRRSRLRTTTAPGNKALFGVTWRYLAAGFAGVLANFFWIASMRSFASLAYLEPGSLKMASL